MNEPRSASATMRRLGLLVDGPVLWERAVPSRQAGVFVVELPSPIAVAPLDLAALARWLDRVPELSLDGARPTAHSLAAQLARFWLPDEQIVYVGRSKKSIGARLAAMYATPLGDNRPQSAGHWLRTLSALPKLRIWWTETEADEEYADALLTEVAERQPAGVRDALPGAPLVLPFANLDSPTGAAKPHDLEASLRTPAERPVGASQPARRGRGARAVRSSGGAPAGRVRAGQAGGPPPPAPTLLSEDGVARLEEELEHLRSNVRPGVIGRVKAARELGDLRENADYEAARREQSFVEGRVQALEALIRSAVVVGADAGGTISIGTTVVVEVDGARETWTIVGSSEADPAAGRISYAAPVGQSLLGRRAGDEAVARLPGGELRLRVIEVR